MKHRVAEMTAGQADRLLQLYPKDPNVFNMLKDVKIYLAWREAKEAGGAAAAGGGTAPLAAAAGAGTGGEQEEEEEEEEEEGEAAAAEDDEEDGDEEEEEDGEGDGDEEEEEEESEGRDGSIVGETSAGWESDDDMADIKVQLPAPGAKAAAEGAEGGVLLGGGGGGGGADSQESYQEREGFDPQKLPSLPSVMA